jgi:membrane-associated protein
MELLQQLLDIFLHLDVHLTEWVGVLGPWTYLLLFAVVFCETGLVVTPFLPGDSLLFALGALASVEGSTLRLSVLLGTLITAAILGDAVNYAIGYRIGPRVFKSETSRLLNKHHLLRTQHFYQKHGGKTIVLARFMPIFRTFAPFVAGIGKMSYRRFALYNVSGGIAWVSSFLLAGYYFGAIPAIKRNFHIVIVAIVVISAIPPLIEVLRAHRAARSAKGVAPEPS